MRKRDHGPWLHLRTIEVPVPRGDNMNSSSVTSAASPSSESVGFAVCGLRFALWVPTCTARNENSVRNRDLEAGGLAPNNNTCPVDEVRLRRRTLRCVLLRTFFSPLSPSPFPHSLPPSLTSSLPGKWPPKIHIRLQFITLHSVLFSFFIFLPLTNGPVHSISITIISYRSHDHHLHHNHHHQLIDRPSIHRSSRLKSKSTTLLCKTLHLIIE